MSFSVSCFFFSYLRGVFFVNSIIENYSCISAGIFCLILLFKSNKLRSDVLYGLPDSASESRRGHLQYSHEFVPDSETLKLRPTLGTQDKLGKLLELITVGTHMRHVPNSNTIAASVLNPSSVFVSSHSILLQVWCAAVRWRKCPACPNGRVPSPMTANSISGH